MLRLAIIYLAFLHMLSPCIAKVKVDSTISSLGPAYDEARAQIEKFGPGQVLVVFDLDNTILHSKQLLGGYAWYKWQEKMLRDAQVAQEGRVADSLDELFYINGLFYSYGSMHLTDPRLLKFIAEMRAKGVALLCLTSRGPIYWAASIRDLQKNGLSFEHEQWKVNELAYARPAYDEKELQSRFGFEHERIERSKLIQPVQIMLRSGVFFTSGLHKGAMLELLLKSVPLSPKAIIFIDDSKTNTTNIKDSFASGETELSAFRYSRYDEEVENFEKHSKKKAMRLWKEWQHIHASLDAKALNAFLHKNFQ